MEILGIGRGWVGNECGTDRRFGHGYDIVRVHQHDDNASPSPTSPSTVTAHCARLVPPHATTTTVHADILSLSPLMRTRVTPATHQRQRHRFLLTSPSPSTRSSPHPHPRPTTPCSRGRRRHSPRPRPVPPHTPMMPTRNDTAHAICVRCVISHLVLVLLPPPSSSPTPRCNGADATPSSPSPPDDADDTTCSRTTMMTTHLIPTSSLHTQRRRRRGTTQRTQLRALCHLSSRPHPPQLTPSSPQYPRVYPCHSLRASPSRHLTISN